MTRLTLLIVSVICCAFGALYLWGPHDFRNASRIINYVLATGLALFTGQDLLKRGWRAFGVIIGVSYVLAPLIGLVAYAIASNRQYMPAETSGVADRS